MISALKRTCNLNGKMLQLFLTQDCQAKCKVNAVDLLAAKDLDGNGLNVSCEDQLQALHSYTQGSGMNPTNVFTCSYILVKCAIIRLF